MTRNITTSKCVQPLLPSSLPMPRMNDDDDGAVADIVDTVDDDNDNALERLNA